MTSSLPAVERDVVIIRADSPEDLPEWAGRPAVERFFNQKMHPWHDELEDVARGLDYAFSDLPGHGGFLLVAGLDGRLVGGLAMLRTGMKGYVPENLLLFVGVDPELRGRGIGRRLVDQAVAECEGSVKLHVEPHNPAKHLYERCGFEAKYVEMRYLR